ncbi:MAG: preprotein translocase subunit YajC [Clostridium sp.]|uniref:preprotein translocase subunit YajC n=1 Tax=Clostridium sp. DSM 8431 TaxID=1761781 RepID=UPI0008E4C164|nr:preprotein translocase subunit YajC [Clostridium sp. DSM 8431]MCR4943192.1 preprotein translocase subunit YajC [Clostridium sp.]SFU38340.1 preprotein translocase subunit YajC [Clostridium sp. DSM 8431]
MGMLIQLAPMILILVVFYAMILIPERKRKKKYETMISELKVRDEVMTRGGIIGKITNINGDDVILESGPDKVRLKFSKNAIANKVSQEDK